MTENEALTKWCPLVRIGVYADFNDSVAIAVNRDSRPDVRSGCTCIASDCMMWRREIIPRVREPGGYCGLAGPTFAVGPS